MINFTLKKAHAFVLIWKLFQRTVDNKDRSTNVCKYKYAPEFMLAASTRCPVILAAGVCYNSVGRPSWLSRHRERHRQQALTMILIRERRWRLRKSAQWTVTRRSTDYLLNERFLFQIFYQHRSRFFLDHLGRQTINKLSFTVKYETYLGFHVSYFSLLFAYRVISVELLSDNNVQLRAADNKCHRSWRWESRSLIC